MSDNCRWVTYDPTSRYIASAGFDKHIIIWDYRSEVPAIKVLTQSLFSLSPPSSLPLHLLFLKFICYQVQAHEDAINCVDFYVDGFRLVSASLDNTIKVHNPFRHFFHTCCILIYYYSFGIWESKELFYILSKDMLPLLPVPISLPKVFWFSYVIVTEHLKFDLLTNVLS